MRVRGVESSEYVKPKKPQEYQQAKENFRKTMESLKDPEKEKAKEEGKLSREQVEDAVKRLNDTMEAHKTHLNFKLDDESEEWQVSVINSKTDKVIRKIPPDEVLDMVAYIKDMLGLLVDEFV